MTPYQWIPVSSTGKVSEADAIGWYSLKKKKKIDTLSNGKRYIHTYIHTHTHIYIYIYITCLAKWKLLLFASLVQRHIPPLHVGHNPIYLIPCVWRISAPLLSCLFGLRGRGGEWSAICRLTLLYSLIHPLNPNNALIVRVFMKVDYPYLLHPCRTYKLYQTKKSQLRSA